MRIRPTTLVALRELREALRSRWFVLAAASFFILSLALSYLGLAGASRSGLAGFDRTTASLLNLVLLFVPLLTLALGGLTIAGELEDGSLGLLLAQPLTRPEVYFGKYLGLLAAVFASVLIGFGAAGMIVASASGGGDAKVFLLLVLLTLLLAAATLAIGTSISALLSTRAKVIGASFSTWLLLVYLSDLGTIGLILARDLEPAKVFLLSVLNPVQGARILGTLALSERLDILGPAGLFALEHFGLRGTVGLLAGALALSAALPLLIGLSGFKKAVVP